MKIYKIKTPPEILSILRKIEWAPIQDPYLGVDFRKVWEFHNGKIPKGMLIHHINWNKEDSRIENLMCVTRKEHDQLHLLPNRKRVRYKNTIKVDIINN